MLGCLLLAAAGGFVAYQSFTGPDTTTEERTVTTWTADDELRHGAVVQRDTRAFDAGAVLRNRSVYFSSVTPTLNGSYVFRHSGDADPATVRTDLRLVVRAVEAGEGESVLWRVSERVASERTESLAPGREFAVPYEFNVTAQSELAEQVREELGSSRGDVQVRLVADTTVSATAAGETFEGDRTATLEVTPRGDSYSVTTTTAGQRNEPVTEQVTVPVDPDPLARYGGALALVVGLVGAVLVAALDRTGRLDVDSETRETMALARERDSFGEWISTGRVPPAGDDRVVTVDSLTGLVDVAIDSERRVIEDTDSGTFVVLDGATRYEFRPDDGESGALAPVDGPGTGSAQSNGEVSADDSPTGDGAEPRSTDE
ncbi:DUF5305 domain-containing protein [Halosimplex litoreum]|uniref:DUF5305 domain-containing protein n=1 Tax=Halosimplex litoreum TaxID=1198301 RepID=A0A7T3KUP3_9EURY|nr:DUF5305 domain-containing protein [Halosimplex litoreum]QPV62457.1 DUF5305 domain-containing protein [Halosimplex litoreum]